MFGIDSTIIDIGEPKNKFGIAKLEIMVWLLQILGTEGSKCQSQYNRFKSFLVEKLRRGISGDEEMGMCKAILAYIQSEPGTNERRKAMTDLYNLNFLSDAGNSSNSVQPAG